MNGRDSLSGKLLSTVVLRIPRSPMVRISDVIIKFAPSPSPFSGRSLASSVGWLSMTPTAEGGGKLCIEYGVRSTYLGSVPYVMRDELLRGLKAWRLASSRIYVVDQSGADVTLAF